ncbi:MAG: hypothetical protein R6U68_10100 [Desulfobacteraceae bacterium]
MKKLNPAYAEAIAQTINTCPYFRLLSMEMKELCTIKVTGLLLYHKEM